MRAQRTSPATRVLTGDAEATTFTFDAWVANPVAENDPNTTPPADNAVVTTNRVVHVNAFRKGAVQLMGLGSIRTVVIGGTTLTYQPWFFDATLNTWVKFGATSAITVATTNTAAHGVGAMVGAKFFFQVTAQTGNPTQFGYVHV